MGTGVPSPKSVPAPGVGKVGGKSPGGSGKGISKGDLGKIRPAFKGK